MIADTYFNDATTQDGDVTYRPFIKDGRVGYRVEHVDGRIEYLYFNPSDTEGASNEWNVFVYQGDSGEPVDDYPAHFYNVLDAEQNREHAIIEAARRVLDIYRRPKQYDAEEYDDAMTRLADALPAEPQPPVRPAHEDDPF